MRGLFNILVVLSICASLLGVQGQRYNTFLKALDAYNLTLLSTVGFVSEEVAALLNDPTAEATLFAPTDEALYELQELLNLNLSVLLNQESLLTMILNYHVLSSKVLSSELKNGQELETLTLNMLVVDLKDGEVQINGTGTSATVIEADILPARGAVHIIDKVLLPEKLEEPTKVEAYLTLSQSVEANLLEILSTAVSAAEFPNDNKFSKAYYDTMEVTFFAPADQALINMESEYGLDISTLVFTQQLLNQQILMNHMVPGVYVSGDLRDGLSLPTFAEGEYLVVGRSEEGARIMSNISTAGIVKADVFAGNAVMHIVDSVLLPFIPEPVEEGLVYRDLLTFFRDQGLNILTATAYASDTFKQSLQDPNFALTVLAPTDEAFKQLSIRAGVSVSTYLSNQTALDQIMRYHVITKRLSAQDLVDGDKYITLLANGIVTVDRDEGDIRFVGVGSSAGIVSADITAAKGRAHIIDTVLLAEETIENAVPETPETTIYLISDSKPETAIFSEAFILTNLTEMFGVANNPATLLVPTNEAFQSLLDDLGVPMQEISINGFGLQELIMYHVLPEKQLVSNFTSGMVLETFLEGQTLEVKRDDDNLALIASGSEAVIVEADFEVGISVFHLIDKVLLPFDASEAKAAIAAADEVEEGQVPINQTSIGQLVSFIDTLFNS